MRQTWIQNAFNAGELSPYLEGRTDVTKYAAGAKTIENFWIRPTGGLTRRTGTKFVLSCKSASARSRLVPFVFSNLQAYVLEFSNNNIRIFKDEGVVLSVGVPVDVTTTYTTAQLPDLSFAQSNDTLYIVHPEHKPAKLTRTSHTAWTLADIAFIDGPWLPENETVTTFSSAATTGSNIVLTAAGGTFAFAATDVGRQVRLHKEGFSSVDFWGFARIVTFTDTTHVRIDIDPDYPFQSTAATKRWRLSPFSSAATLGYPRAVSFFEQRLLYAGNPGGPQSIYGSKSGKYDTFSPTTNVDAVSGGSNILDDNGFTYTIASNQVQNIFWMNSIRSLIIGTDNGIWSLQASSAGEAVTPTNVQVKRTTVTGSAAVQSVNVDDEVVFISDTSRKILVVGYEFERDSYTPVDLSLYAEHIGLSGIEEIAYAHEPNATCYFVRTDGTLVAGVYVREQSVYGFSRFIIGGTFGAGNAVVESVAVIPSPNADHDQVWITVKRTINGATTRYIEFFEEELAINAVQDDAFFVDSGLSTTGAPSTGPFVLTHLTGETLKVLGDGAVQPDVTGSAAVTIATAASTVHIGLPYDSNLEIFRAETQDREGSAQSRDGRAPYVVLRFYRTIGGKVGQDASHLDDMQFRETTDPMDEPVPFFTGDYRHTIDATYDARAGLYLRQSVPLPMTLLALIQPVWTGER